MRMTIAAVFAAAFTISVSAQEFSAGSGTPAVAFPKPDRPVANIVSPIWHDEKERDNAGEPTQLVRLLGIKSGMTVADIGAGTGYYVVRLSPIVGPRGRIIAEDALTALRKFSPFLPSISPGEKCFRSRSTSTLTTSEAYSALPLGTAWLLPLP
jgi:predicted methyltransferase